MPDLARDGVTSIASLAMPIEMIDRFAGLGGMPD
jgi:hypothetical protein